MSPIKKQWGLVAGIVLALSAGVAVTAMLRDEIVFVQPGSKAPPFEARNVATDSVVSLDAYRGKVVLLNIWATWCAPCRTEMPSLERLHRRFLGTDFRVVAVSVDIAEEKVVEDFAREMALSFDILQDRSTAIQRIYQTTGVPESFVIDRHGVIVKKEIGDRQWDSPMNETLIQRLLDAR
jgi:cytochrome c biogenesis protein CcmG/thiol:disulfide interchange protein DsbE